MRNHTAYTYIAALLILGALLLALATTQSEPQAEIGTALTCTLEADGAVTCIER